MQIRVLGPVELELDDGLVGLGAPKQRALLALLALHAGSAVPVDTLVEGLWGEDEQPPSAHKMVQLYVSQLRKLLGSEAIVTRGRGYELRVDPDAVDALRFERLVERAGRERDGARVQAAREALALWRGTPLVDVLGEPFAAAHARRLEELRLAAMEVALTAELEAGGHAELLSRLESLVAEHPLRERLHELLVLALYRAGRQADALEAYRAARQTLVEHAGLEPGPRLRRLQEAVLAQDPALDAGVPGPDWARDRTADLVARTAGQAARRRGELQADEAALAADLVDLQELRDDEPTGPVAEGRAVCPFKGLASFEEADAPYFFGRERLVAEMVARLVGAPLLALVGASGSGKSSALRAGLLPALAGGALPGSEGWQRVLLRPGARPLDRLREALAAARPEPGARVVVAVDQFEEVFTAGADAAEREAFFDALADATERQDGRVLVVVALRADFYGACAAHARLARLLARTHVLVGPMRPEELARAIENPARRAGLAVEPELVERLVADVARTPAALPLLSTALLELWQRRDGPRLRLADHERAGGVEGAVARLAEDAYSGLEPAEQEAARRILLRLAGPGEGEAAVRRSVSLDELEADADPTTRRTLEALAAGRLVTLDEEAAEVAHEALLREWPRLRGWLEQDAEGRRLQHRIATDARRWEAGGRDPADLLRGARLSAALDWAATATAAPNRLEREFLEEGRLAAEHDAERARSTNRRLRALLAGAVVALALATAAGLLALDQRGDARRTALVADAQRVGAQAQTEERLDRAMLLARAGVVLHDSVATRGNLLSVLLGAPPAALGVLQGPEADPEIYSVGASPDGRVVALGDASGAVTAYDTATRRRLGVHRLAPRSGDAVVQSTAFSPDGRVLAAGGEIFPTGTPVVDLLEPRSMRRVRRIELPPGPDVEGGFVGNEVLFLAGGRQLLVNRLPIGRSPVPPSSLLRYDAVTGKPVGRRLPVGRQAAAMAPTAGGRRVLLSSEGEGVTYELDAATLRVVRRHPVAGNAVAGSRDGRRLALGADDGSVRLVDATSAAARRMAGRHPAPVLRVAVTPDGRSVISTDEEGGVRAWDAATGRLRERFDAHRDQIFGLDLSPDGRTLYTAGDDGRGFIWDLSGERRVVRAFPVGRAFPDIATPRGLAVSPDGRTLAVTHGNGTADLIDTATLRRRATVGGLRGFAAAVAFGPDSRLLAITGEGGQLHVHDARTLERVADLRGMGANSQAVAFSPDGRIVAAAEVDTGRPLLRLWDVRRGTPIGPGEEAPSMPALVFSPDGRHLAVAASDNDTEIRDGRTGRLVRRLREPAIARSVAFSRDGRLLATGDYDGGVRLYSTSTWRQVGAALQAHSQRVTSLGFTPDARVLATGSADGSTRLWDVATRQPVGKPLVLQPDTFVSMVLDPRGAHLYAVPPAGPAVRLALDPTAWSRHACLVGGRDLSAAEWRTVLPGRTQRAVC